MIKKGDILQIRSDWKDGDEDRYGWKTVSDEEHGTVDIRPINFEFEFTPH